MPKGEKTACRGPLDSQEKEVVKIPFWGMQARRGSFPLAAVANTSLGKELLKAPEVSARTSETSIARSDRKTGVERKMIKRGCAGRARK